MTRSDHFKELIWSSSALESALKENPALLNDQDEDGKTLLHHVATFGPLRISSSIGEILRVLFNNPNLDFTIKDYAGNTPLHVAALCCEDRTTYQYVFPTLVSEAARRGFDFSTLGQNGQTVLHISTRTSYSFRIAGMFAKRMNNVNNVLENAANPGLNVLSTSGSTAFLYAVNHCHFEEANALLNAGANPSLCGTPDRNAFAMIEEHIVTTTDALNEEADLGEQADQQKITDFQNMLKTLNILKARMLSIVTEKSASEVNKNAMVVSLGSRDNVSFFNKLPPEVLTKIAGLTATNGVHTQDGAEKIASRHFEQKHQSTLRAYSLYSVEPNSDSQNNTRSTMVESSLSNSVDTPALKRSSCMNLSYRR